MKSDYDAVIADLESEREKLSVAIDALRALRADRVSVRTVTERKQQKQQTMPPVRGAPGGGKTMVALILDVLAEHPEPMSAATIAGKIGESDKAMNIGVQLAKLASDQRVRRVGPGLYASAPFARNGATA